MSKAHIFLSVTAGGCNVIEWTAILLFCLISPPWKNTLTCTRTGDPADNKKQSSIWSSQTIEFQLLNSSQSSSCILQVPKLLKWTVSILWISPNVIPKSDKKSSPSPWPGSLQGQAISAFKNYTVNHNLAYQHPHSECTECTVSG